MKRCFVIAPIGDEGDETRIKSDHVLEEIIKPAVLEYEFDAKRADEIGAPGMITHMVIGRLVNDPLVVADLTGGNPNVYYELAIRHALGRPLIQLIPKGEPLRFDVQGMRTVVFNPADTVDAIAKMDVELQELDQSGEMTTPISAALEKKQLERVRDGILGSRPKKQLLRELHREAREILELEPGAECEERLEALERTLRVATDFYRD